MCDKRNDLSNVEKSNLAITLPIEHTFETNKGNLNRLSRSSVMLDKAFLFLEIKAAILENGVQKKVGN